MIIFIIWYLIGFISFHIASYVIDREITAKDVIVSLFVSLLGLISTFIVTIIIINKYNVFDRLNKYLENLVIIKRR